MSPSPRHSYLLLAGVMVAALLLAAGCLSDRETASPGEAGNATPERLTYYTEDHPPYDYLENGTLKGFAVDLVEAVAAKAGQPVIREEIRVAPWSEAYEAALTRNGTVLFITARLPEREQSFKWVGPIATDHNVLFARHGSGIAIRSPEDLKGYRIGVVTGDFGTQQLLNAGVNESQLVSESNVSELVHMLESGEIDLWSYREMGGRYYSEQQTGNYNSFRIVYTFDDVEGCIAFNRNTSDATVASFQRALDGLKQERDAANVSAYERILGRYAPSVGLAQLTAVVNATTGDVNATLQEMDRNLASAAADLGRTGITGPAANATLARLAASSPHAEDAVTITPEGRIVAVMPEEYRGAIGAEVGNESHNQQALRERRPLMTPVFAAVEGFDAVGIRRPVTDGTGAFLGLVEVVFKPSRLLEDSADHSLAGTSFTAWAIDTDGRLIYDRDPGDLVGRNMITDPLFAGYPELVTLTKRMAVEPAGSGTYSFTPTGGGPAVRKEAVWATAGLHGTEWRILVAREG